MNDSIVIKGAREHNLRNIDVTIPRGRLVVLTGLSGSGKSSLAFDTIYAEGQRRYVESLSTYARQFLDQMEKPDVDSIEGLSPAVSIEQKTSSRNPRSTAGTVTEVYDFLRLLFSCVGRPHCYHCGKEISAQSIGQIVEQLLALEPRTRLEILAPVVRDRKGEYRKELVALRKQGFVRVRVDGEMAELGQDLRLSRHQRHSIDVVVDRLIIRAGIDKRLTDSIEIALGLGNGHITVLSSKRGGGEPCQTTYSQKHACQDCGISFPEISPRLFSFNSHQGACLECNGLGRTTTMEPARLVVDTGKAVTEGAIPAWNKRFAKKYAWALRGITDHYGTSPETPFGELPEEVRDALLYGSEDKGIKAVSTSGQTSEKSMRKFAGIIPILDRRYRESESDFVRSELERYMAEHQCSQCQGTRLRLEARQVFVGGRAIHELCAMPVSEVTGFVGGLKLRVMERRVAKLVLREIKERLGFLLDVGLGYLSLDRPASTLSGGESQRIRLATQIGAGLSGVLYVLDEPSIGLHQRDNARLLESLKQLTKSGNSVLVVEHDEETIRAADYVIDMGPGAGRQGGAIVSCGTAEGLKLDEHSLTGRFLSGRERIEIPRQRRSGIGKTIRLKNVTHHNLKGVDVDFPLGCLICVTGVSGSGKSSLVVDTLYPALANRLHGADREVGEMAEMHGADAVDKVIDIDQAPIGRTPRSNPATYTGLFSDIRALFAGVPEARMRGYSLGRFSFNVAGGRCEGCSGDGVNRIEMHFLPDVYVTCELCQGRRYNRETLQIRYKGKTVADLLDMTVTEALDLLQAVPPARRKLETLAAVGLEYLHLGQSATTLSGGEAQRIKLAKELARTATGKTVYILDEPTTGLHFADVRNLLNVLNRLTEAGNTIIIIEHNIDVVKTADYLIDLGPEGGNEGGEVVAAGSPEEVAACEGSHTAFYLKRALDPEKS